MDENKLPEGNALSVSTMQLNFRAKLSGWSKLAFVTISILVFYALSSFITRVLAFDTSSILIFEVPTNKAFTVSFAVMVMALIVLAEYISRSTSIILFEPATDAGYQPQISASFKKRFAAILIDYSILLVLEFFLSILFIMPETIQLALSPVYDLDINGFGQECGYVLLLWIPLLYFAGFASSNFQATPGRALLQLDVLLKAGQSVFTKADLAKSSLPEMTLLAIASFLIMLTSFDNMTFLHITSWQSQIVQMFELISVVSLLSLPVLNGKTQTCLDACLGRLLVESSSSISGQRWTKLERAARDCARTRPNWPRRIALGLTALAIAVALSANLPLLAKFFPTTIASIYLVEKGLALDSRGESPEAQQIFGQAREACPDPKVAYEFIECVLSHEIPPQLRLAIAHRVSLLDRNKVNGLLHEASINWITGRRSEAIALCLQARDAEEIKNIVPNPLLTNVAQDLMKYECPEVAETILTKQIAAVNYAMQLDPLTIKSYHREFLYQLRARCYSVMGQPEKAAADLKEANVPIESR